jgi:hypothetical protein
VNVEVIGGVSGVTFSAATRLLLFPEAVATALNPRLSVLVLRHDEVAVVDAVPDTEVDVLAVLTWEWVL